MIDTKAALRQGATDWLKLTGESFQYRSSITGIAQSISATLEQDVSTVDDQGMYSRGLMLNIDPLEIPSESIQRGDIVTDSNGKRYRFDEILDSPGYLTRVLVSPA